MIPHQGRFCPTPTLRSKARLAEAHALLAHHAHNLPRFARPTGTVSCPLVCSVLPSAAGHGVLTVRRQAGLVSWRDPS
jgi:hypothetical protein